MYYIHIMLLYYIIQCILSYLCVKIKFQTNNNSCLIHILNNIDIKIN